LSLPKADQVHLETGDKHQQQLSHVRKEIHNRPLLPKYAKNMGPDDDTTE
jgi:hypothetical protein